MGTKGKIWMMTTVLAVLAMTSSCSGAGRKENPVGPLPGSAYSVMSSGTAYLLIGKPGSGNVWQVDLKTHHSQQLTNNPSEYGISWISASSAGLAAADASTGVDNISIYRSRRLYNLAGYGGSPAISMAGSVAYIEVPDVVSHSGPQTWRIGVTSSSGGSTRVLYQQDQPDLGALAYGPNDDLAVISAPGPHAGQPATTEVLVLSANGNIKKRVRPLIGDIGFLAWNDKAPGIAVGGLSGDEELINPADSSDRRNTATVTAGNRSPVSG
jgi:hypothetical protein